MVIVMVIVVIMRACVCMWVLPCMAGPAVVLEDLGGLLDVQQVDLTPITDLFADVTGAVGLVQQTAELLGCSRSSSVWGWGVDAPWGGEHQLHRPGHATMRASCGRARIQAACEQSRSLTVLSSQAGGVVC